MADWDPLAIYIHWPYCARICPYCDFNVYKNRDDEDLIAAISEDLSSWRDRSGPRQVTSIHFGGGTPSLMPADDIARLIAAVDRLWNIKSDIEIALEANPIDYKKFTGIKNAGVNRMSLGVQSFHDPALALLGRDHNGDMAQRAVDMAMDVFPSVSVDLIFGWSGQTADLWQEDLDRTAELGVHHISTYQLTIEDNTAFARAEDRGERKAVCDDESGGLYDQLAEFLTGRGLDHYEVSNFARPGHQSRHNLAYWRGWDYVGVGPGAHGRLTVDGQKRATIAARRPGKYVQSVIQNGWGVSDIEILTPESWADEYVIMGLRIAEGLSLSRWAEIKQAVLPDQEISDLIEQGYLVQNGDRMSATPAGRAVLNRITDMLLT